jgi:PAS domain S-box-containing protein
LKSFSRPYISAASGNLAVNVILPLKKGGYLLGELNLDYLQEQVLETTGTTENNRLIFISDRFGNLLAHPDRTLLEQQINWGSLPLLRAINEKNSIVEEFFSIEGKRYLATGVPIPEAGWILVVAVSASDIVLDMIGFVILINGLFILLFLMLLFTTSGIIRKTIVNPLTYMFHILERSVIEEQPRHIDSGFSELDTIQKAFNTMSERVRSNTEKLSRFERAVSEAGYAIYMTAADGTILYVNPAFVRITGYSQEEALGNNPDMLSSGMRPGTCFSSFWDTISGGSIWEEEIVNCRKDGTLYYANQTVAPITGEEGRVSSYVAIQTDVTQQRESETLYRSLFENAADSILLIDSGTLQIRECNQAAHTILSYSRDELKQLSYDELLDPEIRSSVQELLSAPPENGLKAFESRHLTRDGKVREVTVHMTSLNLGGGLFSSRLFMI